MAKPPTDEQLDELARLAIPLLDKLSDEPLQPWRTRVTLEAREERLLDELALVRQELRGLNT